MTADKLPMCPRCETIWRLTMNKQQHLILSSPTKSNADVVEESRRPAPHSLPRTRPTHCDAQCEGRLTESHVAAARPSGRVS